MSDGRFTIIDDGQALEVDAREGVDGAQRAEAAGRPVALDHDEGAAYLGVSAAERGRRLASLEAPDFTFPDLEGRSHSLAEHRGKKVFLVAYGSW